MKLIFGTGNLAKISEAQTILSDFEIQGLNIEIEEIQSLDPKKVAIRKAHDYFSIAKKPLFIEDVSLSFAGLNNLPGTYIDAFMQSLGNKGILNLMNSLTSRDAIALITLVYLDIKGVNHIFQSEMKGKIAIEERGDNGFGWDTIFIPTNQPLTLGEMSLTGKNNYSMRALALRQFRDWLIKNP